jgi:DNA-binding response OmpR family regulator
VTAHNNFFTAGSQPGNRFAAPPGQAATPMEATASDEILRVGDLEIRPRDGLVLASGRALTLSVREFHLLVALVRRSGRIVSREELYGIVWGSPLRAGDRSIDVYVHKLRVKLEDALPDWRFIHTHVGFGYRLAAELLHPFHTNTTGR